MMLPEVPIAEMLWEPVDPLPRLRQFGFDGAEQATQWILRSVDALWAIDPRACSRLVLSGTNAVAWLDCKGGSYIAKVATQPLLFPRLSESAAVAHWLASQGLPVSAPLRARTSEFRPSANGRLLEVQVCVDGSHLDTEQPQEVAQSGAALAALHLALARYPADVSVRAVIPVQACELTARIDTWLGYFGDTLPSELVRLTRHAFDQLGPSDLEQQLVHWDFRSANVICSEGMVRAILDWEELAVDYPLADLARAVALLGTRFRDWAPVSIQVMSTFLRAYDNVRPLSAAERSWLGPTVMWQMLDASRSGWRVEDWWAHVSALATCDAPLF